MRDNFIIAEVVDLRPSERAEQESRQQETKIDGGNHSTNEMRMKESTQPRLAVCGCLQ